MIIFAREDKDLVLQESTRADEQAGGNGGVERRDEHLENMSIDPFGHQIQRCAQGRRRSCSRVDLCNGELLKESALHAASTAQEESQAGRVRRRGAEARRLVETCEATCEARPA